MSLWWMVAKHSVFWWKGSLQVGCKCLRHAPHHHHPLSTPLATGRGGRAPCIHFCSLHNLATIMFEAFHWNESWLERSLMPKRCWVWVLLCSEWGGEHEVTCFAGIEDMGDTPVMSALWDNGMHKPASCYVSSLSSRGRNSNKNNAETCHVDKLGTHMYAVLEEWLVECEGNIIRFLHGIQMWSMCIELNKSTPNKACCTWSVQELCGSDFAQDSHSYNFKICF